MSFTDDNEKDCGEDITDDESEKVMTMTTLMILLCIKSSIAYTLPFT